MNVVTSLVFCLLCAQITALNFYVSPDGSDHNSGNRSAPFQTISFAYSQIPSSDPKQHSKIWIESGVYELSTNYVNVKPANVEFVAVAGGNVVFTCDYFSIGWFWWDWTTQLDDLWYTTKLQGITIKNCTNAFHINPLIGLQKKGGMHFQIQNVIAGAGFVFGCPILGASPGQTACTVSFIGCAFEKSEGFLMYGITANTVTSVSVTSCTFSRCTSALNVSNAATVTVNDVSISHSVIPLVWTPSALIFASDVTALTITDLTVTNNTGALTGLAISNCASVSVNSVVFDSNKMWYSADIELSPNVSFNDITIRESHSNGYLMQLSSSGVHMNNSLLESNNGGSAIAVVGGASLFLASSQLSYNSVPTSGGGVSLLDGTFVATDCLFQGNKAANSGGALYAEQGKVALLNSVFTENSAPSGGASWCSSGSVSYQASHCTFTNNTSKNNPVQCGNNNTPQTAEAWFLI